MENKKALTSEEWGKLYNSDKVESLVSGIRTGNVSVWSKELVRITKTDEKILEIGCGTGVTSVWLAMQKRKAVALDFSKEALACAQGVAEKCHVEMETVFADATKELPFEENTFDTIFQAGLLEHFDRDERIRLLRLWSRYGKRMISLIPNAASIAYRTGKALSEADGTWEYGKELPQYTMVGEFMEAGIRVTEEYTIGAEHALNFLPKSHYLRKALEKWLKANPCEDICGQGYLLVTIGEKFSF